MTNASAPIILIIDDDEGIHEMLPWTIQASLPNAKIVHARNVPEALQMLRDHQPDVAVIDLGLPPDPSNSSEGLKIIEAIRAAQDSLFHTQMIVFSGATDSQQKMEVASKRVLFIPKDTDPRAISALIACLADSATLHKQNHELRKQVFSDDDIIGNSDELLAALSKIKRIAPTSQSIFIHGESGVGKELFAKRIHEQSGRTGRFIPLNCGGLTESLLDSELFGHEKGAFTGASSSKAGLIEEAQNGTLFLDEIGDMPPALQVKLLRFLQEGKIRRVGGTKEISVNVRIVCATHRNLQEMCRTGDFREDLFYRINDFKIHVPALRDRGSDILLLAETVLTREKSANTHYQHILGFDDSSKMALLNHSWPGNVRELISVVRKACVFCDSEFITFEHLDLPMPAGLTRLPLRTSTHIDVPLAGELTNLTLENVMTLKEYRTVSEGMYINRVIDLCDGNKSKAASLLDIGRAVIYERMNSVQK